MYDPVWSFQKLWRDIMSLFCDIALKVGNIHQQACDACLCV